MKITHFSMSLALVFAFVTVTAASGPQYELTTLATFTGANGANPFGGLIADASGNLYGTTRNGGLGYGTVFEVMNDASHTLATLATFNVSNGWGPEAGLIADASGNLYGTTPSGGGPGYGTVFKVAAGTHGLSTLASFSSNFPDGAYPTGRLLADSSGNLYGTTYSGGFGGNLGIVYKVANDPGHTLTTLASFNGDNGRNPQSSLIADASGNLYGTTKGGGLQAAGTVFKLAGDASHTLTAVASLDVTTGTNPVAGVIADSVGNFYGVTTYGGAGNGGTVFRVDAITHSVTVLAAFDGKNGSYPYGDLIFDASGNLYGTTYVGGANGFGTVFMLANDTSHTLTTLATFDGLNGAYSLAPLLADGAGNFYGTTTGDNVHNNGTVFKLSPVPEPESSVLALSAAATWFFYGLLRRRRFLG